MIMGRGLSFMLLAIGAPSGGDIASCATCAASLTTAAITESGKLAAETPSVPSTSARPRATPPPRGRVRVALKAGDVVEEDEVGNVSAIRHATSPTTWTRFKRGAVSPAGVDWVEGELAP